MGESLSQERESGSASGMQVPIDRSTLNSGRSIDSEPGQELGLMLEFGGRNV
jgi:hypothetical protein